MTKFPALPSKNQSWLQYTASLWGDNWGVCRATESNLSRYNRCVKRSEYNQAKIAYDSTLPIFE